MPRLIDPLDAYVLGAALVSFGLFLAVHVAVFRYGRPRRITPPLIVSFAAGFLLDAGAAFMLVGYPTETLASYSEAARWLGGSAALAVYSLVTLHYLSWVFGMGEAAIRIRILLELERRPGGTATLQEIHDGYNDETILKIRLAKLVGAGYLQKDGPTYRVRRKAVFLQSKMIGLLKTALGLEK